MIKTFFDLEKFILMDKTRAGPYPKFTTKEKP